MSRAQTNATILLMPLYVIAAILLFVALATPVAANQPNDIHCPQPAGHSVKITVPVTIDGVNIWYDGPTFYVQNTNDFDVEISFCVKGGSKFWNDTYNTYTTEGILSIIVGAGGMGGFIGNQDVSYAVVYDIIPRHSPTPEPSQSEEPTPEPSQSEEPTPTPQVTTTPEPSATPFPSAVGTPEETTNECLEDQPCWNCETMGNQQCGNIPDTAMDEAASKGDLLLLTIASALFALAFLLHLRTQHKDHD